MGCNMKTTIDITDSLLQEAKKISAHKHTTLRSLIEEGLRSVIAKHKTSEHTFKLRKASFKGKGLQSEFQDNGWGKIRAAIYKGYGG